MTTSRKERRLRKLHKRAEILDGIDAALRATCDKHSNSVPVQLLWHAADDYLHDLCRRYPQEAALIRQVGREWQEAFQQRLAEEKSDE